MGNVVVPIVSVVLLAHLWVRRKPRPPWLMGSVVGVAAFVIVLVGSIAYSTLLWRPPPNAWVSFRPSTIVIWLSAYPIQLPASWVFGNDSIIEEHLMIPTALMTWAFAGATVAFARRRFHRVRQWEPTSHAPISRRSASR